MRCCAVSPNNYPVIAYFVFYGVAATVLPLDTAGYCYSTAAAPRVYHNTARHCAGAQYTEYTNDTIPGYRISTSVLYLSQTWHHRPASASASPETLKSPS
jgi:hypothetical protein